MRPATAFLTFLCLGLAAAVSAQPCAPDTVAPVVTVPAPITVAQTLCSGGSPGARAEDAFALAVYLAGSTAADDCDPAPLRLAPQIGGIDVTTTTVLPVGISTVTFRWQDATGNTGSSDSSVEVLLFFGDLDESGAITASDLVALANSLVGNVAPGTPPFSAPAAAGDLDQNGSLAATDLVLLANHLVGNIPCVPATCPAGAVRPCSMTLGSCVAGTQTCSGGSWGSCSGAMPSPEVCDGADNDCDGSFAESCPPGCGDGIRQVAEQCDDGGTGNTDGCGAGCLFEQAQRANSLTMRFATDPYCTANALGGAFVGGVAQGQLQAALSASVANGSTSVLMPILGLDDLSGTNDGAVQVGILNGTPVVPGATAYDGTNDLDWWHTADPAGLDAFRLPTSQLAGAIAGGVLDAGPGNATLVLQLGSGPVPLNVSSMRMRWTSGPASAPLTSSGGLPPGHLPAENLDPALTSFATTNAGRICADVSAASLGQVPIPAALVGCTATTCSQCYTAANSLLDLLVGGCTVFFTTQIAPTQPDRDDPAVPAAGAGPNYTLQANVSRVVTTCLDMNSQVVNLADCLADAAYSSSFDMTTNRTIPK